MDSTGTFLKILGKDTIKLDRMDGMSFTRWHEKLKFMLTTLNVYYVLGPNRRAIVELMMEVFAKEHMTTCYVVGTFSLLSLIVCTISSLHCNPQRRYRILLKTSRTSRSTRLELKIEIPEKLLVGAIIAKLPHHGIITARS